MNGLGWGVNSRPAVKVVADETNNAHETIAMKKLNHFLLAAFAAGTVQMASAVNYSPTHLMLVFRQDGTKDVEFDIGSVSNYLALANGAQTSVTYNLNTVVTNFGGSLNNVKFAVVATTDPLGDPLPRCWTTDGHVFTAAADMSGSGFNGLQSDINNVGVAASIYTVSNAAPFVVNVSGAPNSSGSYDYIVSGGTLASVSTMNGDAPTPVGSITPLPVDALFPTTLAFYEVQLNNTTPKPPGTLAGAFTLDVNGTLTFTRGALPPLYAAAVTGVGVDTLGGSATVSFSTTNGVNYQLQYSTSPTGGWVAVPGALANGNNTVQSLTNFSATDPARFYRVKSVY